MMSDAAVFLEKAMESLAGAESELASGRYNNCANRCYYACFLAAIAALIHTGIEPRGANGQWGHEFVQSEFVGQLIHRRKIYPQEMRDVLSRLLELRKKADYELQRTTQTLASRAFRQSRQFVSAIRATRGEEL